MIPGHRDADGDPFARRLMRRATRTLPMRRLPRGLTHWAIRRRPNARQPRAPSHGLNQGEELAAGEPLAAGTGVPTSLARAASTSFIWLILVW